MSFLFDLCLFGGFEGWRGGGGGESQIVMLKIFLCMSPGGLYLLIFTVLQIRIEMFKMFTLTYLKNNDFKIKIIK